MKKKGLNQIFSLSLSLSITLSPCALLNFGKAGGGVGGQANGGCGLRGRGTGGRRGAKISISDFHILKALIYLGPGALSHWRDVRGRGGRRRRRTKGEGTYDIFIVESHFHCSCGRHVAQRLHMPALATQALGCLNARRCHDTLLHKCR